MADVAVRDVSRIFGTFRALDRISVDFENGKLFALLGPSGSGKTTLLRLIAGFDFPDEGHITIGGDAVETVPVEKRDVGMMFQNYALFPNMNVFDNIGFGLSVRGMPRSEIRTRVGETLDLVQLQGLDDRRPHQLSGGQKQRVALARALVIRPRVLLLDEPLSALDKALRVDMQVELKRIQREVGITTIFVTHDQEEALSMADRVGVLRDGQLMQEGTPAEIYDRPNSVFSATFLGDANILTGEAKDGQIRLPDGSTIKTDIVPENGSTAVAVRPEKMVFLSDTNPALNAIEATVVSHVFAGSSITTLLDWQGQRLKVFAANAGDTPPPEGTQVRIGFSPDHTVVVAE